MINPNIDLMTKLIDLNNHKAILVNGKPFLIFGIQLDCDDCFSTELIDMLSPQAKEMSCNIDLPPGKGQ
jgi:hypothetical protein